MAKRVVRDDKPASFNINVTLKSSPDLLAYSCQASSDLGTYGPSSWLQMYWELWTSEYRGCGLVRLVGCGSMEGLGEGMVDFEMGGDRRRRQSEDRGQTACLQGCAQSVGDQRTQSPGRGQKAQWGLNGVGHQGIGGSQVPHCHCGSQRSLRLRVLLRLPVSDHICFHLPRYPPSRPFFLPFPPKLSLSVNRNKEVLLASMSPASLPSKNTKAKNLKEGAQGLKPSTWKAGISL